MDVYPREMYSPQRVKTVLKHMKEMSNSNVPEAWCVGVAPLTEPLLVDPPWRVLPECPLDVAKTPAATVAVPYFLVTAVVANVSVLIGSDLP